MGPEPCDLEQVEVVAGRLEHLEAFAVALEHRVLDGVVNHLDEVPGARGADVRVAVGGRQRLERRLDHPEVVRPCRRPSGSTRSSSPRRRRRFRRRGTRSRPVASSAARRAESEKRELPPSTMTSPAESKPASRAIDVLDGLAGGNHQPDDPRRREPSGHVLERARADGARAIPPRGPSPRCAPTRRSRGRPSSSRSTMLPPIFPSPTNPSFMSCLTLDSGSKPTRAAGSPTTRSEQTVHASAVESPRLGTSCARWTRERAPRPRLEGREVARPPAPRSRRSKPHTAAPGIGTTSAGAAAVIWRKTPVSGPPLWSCPVEWRNRGPNPTRRRDALRVADRRAGSASSRSSFSWSSGQVGRDREVVAGTDRSEQRPQRFLVQGVFDCRTPASRLLGLPERISFVRSLASWTLG